MLNVMLNDYDVMRQTPGPVAKLQFVETYGTKLSRIVALRFFPLAPQRRTSAG